ncbi:hypothetical protein V6O07_17030, partial [Arthrospira platensis SPKY2]
RKARPSSRRANDSVGEGDILRAEVSAFSGSANVEIIGIRLEPCGMGAFTAADQGVGMQLGINFSLYMLTP